MSGFQHHAIRLFTALIKHVYKGKEILDTLLKYLNERVYPSEYSIFLARLKNYGRYASFFTICYASSAYKFYAIYITESVLEKCHCIIIKRYNNLITSRVCITDDVIPKTDITTIAPK